MLNMTSNLPALLKVCEPMNFTQRLDLLKEQVAERWKPLSDPYPQVCLFFSVSDGHERAQVVQCSGNSLASAWQAGVTELCEVMRAKDLGAKWLRVDWVQSVQATKMRELKALLHKVKRNYFRLGLAFDPAFKIAFLEQELNANAMLYGGNKIAHATFNEKNTLVYARRKYGSEPFINFADDADVYILATLGIFCDEMGKIHLLKGPGPDAGRRILDRLSGDDVTGLIETSSQFLARQVGADGAFVYGYHPCFDRTINAYNTLRHASSTYALIEAWEVTRDAALMDSIDRALSYLCDECICTLKNPDGSEASFVIEGAKEIKLGANAVAILALAKYATVTGSTKYNALLERLALGIRFMQNEEDGSFIHVLEFPSLRAKEQFRTIYYEGEAAFALMRLYDLTKDQRWLQMVEKAFDHFITQNHWKHHDHWLSYCVNELTRHRPAERYFRFGIQNISDHLDFVLKRITTFPTLLELMMAGSEMLERIDQLPEYRHLLDEIDLDKFYLALEFRAHYLLNGYFWPEMAMYFANPNRIVGSFFIRHHAFRVRIDDVEHYLSGFIAFRRYRNGSPAQIRRETPSSETMCAPSIAAADREGWSAEHVATAAGGRWLVQPPSGWTASGVSTYAPAMKEGNLVVLRNSEKGRGIPIRALEKLPFRPSGFIASREDVAHLKETNLPVLEVQDTSDALLKMGRYARNRLSGKVLAVTGSAGKTTTVSMLAHALDAWGGVHSTSNSANLPHGVAWNLASAPWQAPFVVLELAIGRMAQSARMARPDISLVTNILPAHLGERRTLQDVATEKSAIFQGMAPGSLAVLYRQMQEWEIVHSAAQARQLDILSYGESEDCAFRLLEYDPLSRSVVADLQGKITTYQVGAPGKHMALNSLAILAAVSWLGLPLEPALVRLKHFNPLPGRGQEHELSIQGKRLTVIDDAYNANPGSMAAALEHLSTRNTSGRKVAVLGEMAELGPNASNYHLQLAEAAQGLAIDRFHVVGAHYDDFWQHIPASKQGYKAERLEELRSRLLSEFEDGDVILFKGSHSTRIHQLVHWLTSQQESSSRSSGGRHGNELIGRRYE